MRAKDGRLALIARRVLIVDDEPQIQELLAELLRRSGFSSEAAATIAATKDAAERTPFDAIILDLNLSNDESGVDLLPWFRAQPQYVTTPILVLTGQQDFTEDEQALIRSHGAYMFYKAEPIREVVSYLNRLTSAGD